MDGFGTNRMHAPVSPAGGSRYEPSPMRHGAHNGTDAGKGRTRSPVAFWLHATMSVPIKAGRRAWRARYGMLVRTLETHMERLGSDNRPHARMAAVYLH